MRSCGCTLRGRRSIGCGGRDARWAGVGLAVEAWLENDDLASVFPKVLPELSCGFFDILGMLVRIAFSVRSQFRGFSRDSLVQGVVFDCAPFLEREPCLLYRRQASYSQCAVGFRSVAFESHQKRPADECLRIRTGHYRTCPNGTPRTNYGGPILDSFRRPLWPDGVFGRDSVPSSDLSNPPPLRAGGLFISLFHGLARLSE